MRMRKLHLWPWFAHLREAVKSTKGGAMSVLDNVPDGDVASVANGL
jgi:hypothetical protein